MSREHELSSGYEFCGNCVIRKKEDKKPPVSYVNKKRERTIVRSVCDEIENNQSLVPFLAFAIRNLDTMASTQAHIWETSRALSFKADVQAYS